MKPAFGAALRAAILCSAAIAVSACVYEPYHRGYYGHGESGYYEDPCDQDRAYCDYPMYEGGIYVDGNWYEGRHRYRDNNGRREFYLHGQWYGADQTRDRDHDHDRDGGRDWQNHDRNHDRDHDRDWHDRDHDRSNWRDRDHDSDRDNDRDDGHGPCQLHDRDRDHDDTH